MFRRPAILLNLCQPDSFPYPYAKMSSVRFAVVHAYPLPRRTALAPGRCTRLALESSAVVIVILPGVGSEPPQLPCLRPQHHRRHRPGNVEQPATIPTERERPRY
jgi:hypothetical protein